MTYRGQSAYRPRRISKYSRHGKENSGIGAENRGLGVTDVTSSLRWLQREVKFPIIRFQLGSTCDHVITRLLPGREIYRLSPRLDAFLT